MKPGASGAADAAQQRQADNSNRKQQRASSPSGGKETGSKWTQKSNTQAKSITSKQSGGRSSRGQSPISTATSKERQSFKGAAAVQATGTENLTQMRAVTSERAEERTNIPEDTRCTDLLSPTRGEPIRVVSDQPCSSKSPKLKSKHPRGDSASNGQKKSSKSTVSCGPGFWKEGCLQSELIQFHLNKSLGKKVGKMQTKTPLSPASESELYLEAAIHEPVPPLSDQRLQDKIEKLEDENEELKVNSNACVCF